MYMYKYYTYTPCHQHAHCTNVHKQQSSQQSHTFVINRRPFLVHETQILFGRLSKYKKMIKRNFYSTIHIHQRVSVVQMVGSSGIPLPPSPSFLPSCTTDSAIYLCLTFHFQVALGSHPPRFKTTWNLYHAMVYTRRWFHYDQPHVIQILNTNFIRYWLMTCLPSVSI